MLVSRWFARRPACIAGRRKRLVPCLEPLEDRLAPALFLDFLGGAGNQLAPIAIPPTILAGSDSFTNVGSLFTRMGAMTGVGGKLSATVDFGDGSPVGLVSVDPSGHFTLKHIYTREGSFLVTVTASDAAGQMATAHFHANVLLAGVVLAKELEVAPGTTGTLSFDGETISLSHAADSSRAAYLIAAVVPLAVDAALPHSAYLLDPNLAVTAYDVRVINAAAGDHARIDLAYTANTSAEPTITFFDTRTEFQEPVIARQLTEDLVGHHIHLVLNGRSEPRLRDLGGTVFTITVPLGGPQTPADVYSALLQRRGENLSANGESASLSVTGGDGGLQGSRSAAGGIRTGANSVLSSATGTTAAGGGDVDNHSLAGDGPLAELPLAAPPLLSPGAATIAPATIGPPPLSAPQGPLSIAPQPDRIPREGDDRVDHPPRRQEARQSASAPDQQAEGGEQRVMDAVFASVIEESSKPAPRACDRGLLGLMGCLLLGTTCMLKAMQGEHRPRARWMGWRER
jgi:hypothetical protein